MDAVKMAIVLDKSVAIHVTKHARNASQIAIVQMDVSARTTRVSFVLRMEIAASENFVLTQSASQEIAARIPNVLPRHVSTIHVKNVHKTATAMQDNCVTLRKVSVSRVIAATIPTAMVRSAKAITVSAVHKTLSVERASYVTKPQVSVLLETAENT